VVYIRRGNLTLSEKGEEETFKPGDFVLLPKGFLGNASFTSGYEALVAVAKP
jgi:quercetin dioxygenase-like cupin family protein